MKEAPRQSADLVKVRVLFPYDGHKVGEVIEVPTEEQKRVSHTLLLMTEEKHRQEEKVDQIKKKQEEHERQREHFRLQAEQAAAARLMRAEADAEAAAKRASLLKKALGK